MINNQGQSQAHTKQDLILQIKQMDDQIQHISLNLNKCSINATQNDITKAFPNFKFLNIKKLQPGYFQVELQLRIDAINLIRQMDHQKIANQKFQVTLGNQKKQSNEKWTIYQKKKSPAEIKLEQEKKAAAAKKKQMKKLKLNHNSQNQSQLSQTKTENQQLKTVQQKKQTTPNTTEKSEWFNQDNKKDLQQKNIAQKQQKWTQVLDPKGKYGQKNQKKNKAKGHDEMWKNQLNPNNLNKEPIQNIQNQQQKVKQTPKTEEEKNKEEASKKKKKNKKKPQQNQVKIQENLPKQQDSEWIVVKPKTKKK